MADSNDLRLPSLQRLQSAEQMELLDVVDSLRACGLSDIVALPQLIVCGDQSSGKSSVLEALSGIPFPRLDGLCTRFATEVILRRAPQDVISVSIVPAKGRSQVEQDQLKKFHHDLKSKENFRDLFKLASDAMGLSTAGNSFSNDVLRVEFCGPAQPQLTLVDLPGLIHTETKLQTPADVKLVHGLVTEYLKNPRSIILAVVSAKNDIGNQVILRKAREFDPKGLRTLGIITKPDLLAQGSKSEEAFIALARNEEVKFALGWHVVKNLDLGIPNENLAGERDKEENRFFQESNFNGLPTHTTGIGSLRERLSIVLFKQIQTELPRLVEDIKCHILTTKSTRDKLGPSRKEPDEQRSFLISLSQMFQTICRDAVRGDYDHEFFQTNAGPERRLCANVMNMHFDFAKEMRADGASWLVDDEEADDNKYRTREEAIEEACILLKRSRGRELPGLPNPLLVGELFRQYSRPWGDIARAHIQRIWEAAMEFLELLLQELTDNDTCEKVLRFWLYPAMEERLKCANQKLEELLEVHKDYPMTTNSQFVSQRPKRNQDPSDEFLEEPALKALLQSGEKVTIEQISHILSNRSIKPPLDLDRMAAEEAFDNMNAYYEVAMNLFTDNVPTLAIQGPIIREVPKIFCPTAVDSMETEVINRIAGETRAKVEERDEILRRLQALEKGARICKLYAKRSQPYIKNSSQKSDKSELPSTPKPSSNSDFSERSAGEKSSRLSTSSQRTVPQPRSPESKPPTDRYYGPDFPNSANALNATTKASDESKGSKLCNDSGVSTLASSPFSSFGNPNFNSSNGIFSKSLDASASSGKFATASSSSPSGGLFVFPAVKTATASATTSSSSPSGVFSAFPAVKTATPSATTSESLK